MPPGGPSCGPPPAWCRPPGHLLVCAGCRPAVPMSRKNVGASGCGNRETAGSAAPVRRPGILAGPPLPAWGRPCSAPDALAPAPWSWRTVAAGTSACAAGPSPSASSGRSPRPRGGSAHRAAPRREQVQPTRPAAPPPPPRTAACYRLTTGQLTQPTNALHAGALPAPAHRPHDLRGQAGHRRRRALGRRRLGDRAATARRPPAPASSAAYVGGSAKHARPVPVQRGLVQPHAPSRPTRAPTGSAATWSPSRAATRLARRCPAADGSRACSAAAGARHLRPVRHRGARRAGLPAGDLRAAGTRGGPSTRSRCPGAPQLPGRRDGAHGPVTRGCKARARARAGGRAEVQLRLGVADRGAVGRAASTSATAGRRAEACARPLNPQKPSRRSCLGSRCQSLAILTCRSR